MAIFPSWWQETVVYEDVHYSWSECHKTAGSEIGGAIAGTEYLFSVEKLKPKLQWEKSSGRIFSSTLMMNISITQCSSLQEARLGEQVSQSGKSCKEKASTIHVSSISFLFNISHKISFHESHQAI
ncbi:chitinase domain-containing protein [Salix suchowensis]|nr:chitinase domain-containing protein [Salix suchowensis]